MDPNATLAAMLAAIADGDAPTAGEHWDNLREWVDNGGFLPAELESMATELHSIGAHLDGVNGDEDGDAIDVRVYLADSAPGIRFCYGDPSYDTDHRGHCGASSYDTARGFRGASECLMEAIADALEFFYFATDVR